VSDIVTTSSSLNFCSTSLDATAPSCCPCCTNGRARGVRVRDTWKGRSGIPSQPRTRSARAVFAYDGV
jgi:hypothetical protein